MKSSPFEVIFNFNVNLLHFIDSLSQWSPYCGDTALDLFKSNFQISEKDEEELRKYRLFRSRLGWKNETNLFLWALENFSYKGFSNYVKFEITENKKDRLLLENNKKIMFDNLSQVIKHFQKRKDDRIYLIDILSKRYLMMSEQIESIKEQINLTHKKISKISNLLSIFSTSLNFEGYPIFICFAFSKYSFYGGANGKGVYAEFPVTKDAERIKHGVNLIIHEMLHQILNIKPFMEKFLDMNSAKLDIPYFELLKILEEKDPQGYGKEINVFEEIIVYLFSDVYISNFSIKERIHAYEDNEELREFFRIWSGVKLFKEIFDEYSCKRLSAEDLILQLLNVFIEKIYFRNFE